MFDHLAKVSKYIRGWRNAVPLAISMLVCMIPLREMGMGLTSRILAFFLLYTILVYGFAVAAFISDSRKSHS